MITVLSWNVEHFKGAPGRIDRVVGHVKAQDPDVFGILEVKNADVRDLMENHFEGYDFGLTDGPETQEILVGWRRSAFEGAVFAQKREFKAYNPHLRPGAMLTVKQAGEFHSFLFLHTDSGTRASDFGNRYEMLEHVFRLKRALDRKAPDGNGRLVVMGDLNTMGMRFPRQRKSNQLVSDLGEVLALGDMAGDAGLVLHRKSHSATFFNGRLTGDLDHVMTSEAVTLANLGERDGKSYAVAVEGWPQMDVAERLKFVTEISDHASIRVVIES